jgi:hypothetical protein
MLVGMRASELLSLERDPVFKRSLGGLELDWIRGRTFKGSSDDLGTLTEWLATERVGWICERLDRMSKIHRAPLVGQLAAAFFEYKEANSERQRAKIAKAEDRARRSLNSIFLVKTNRKSFALGSISVASRTILAVWMRRAARRAGLTCPMSPHVLRRSFAYMVVRYCQGDIRYLKEHFKHWSIDTTQLYVTHGARDDELADEIGKAILDAKADLVSSWLDNEVTLSGMAGRRVTETRSKPEFAAILREDRRALAASLADGLVIRSTGHSWCVAAGKPPCGGVGLYDALHCARCDGAVITREELDIWVALKSELQAVAIEDDCGPGGAQAIKRGLASIEEVLEPFTRDQSNGT